MRRAIIGTGGGLVLVVSITGVVFVMGMRSKSPAVVDAVRKLGRATRPLAIKSAGAPGQSTAVVRHVGRTSGRTYETPIGAVPAGDDFVVALPYGPGTDWARNVLAGGSATIVYDGRSTAVDRPEVVPLVDIDHHFSPADRRAHRWFGVVDGLRMRIVDGEGSLA